MPFIHLPVFAQSAYVSLVSWTKSFDPSSHRSHLDRYLLTWEFFFFGQVTSHVILMPTQSSQVVYRQPRPIIKLLLFRCKFALSPIYECFFFFFFRIQFKREFDSKGSATRELPKRSTILILLLPKDA